MGKLTTVLSWLVMEILFAPITYILWAVSPFFSMCIVVLPLVIMLIKNAEEEKKQEELDKSITAMVDRKISPEQFKYFNSQHRR